MAWNDENDSDIVIVRPSGGGGGGGSGGGGGTGTDDYNLLKNRPMIEGVELTGNKTFEALNLQPITNSYIDSLFA